MSGSINRIDMKNLFFILLACLVFPGVVSGATLEGSIKVGAPFPQSASIEVKQKPNRNFPDSLNSETLRISKEGYLKNAVVSVRGDFSQAPGKKKEYVLDQKDYRFEPHLIVVPAGEKLRILNSDPLAHDVRAFDDKAKMLFQYDMEVSGGDALVSFPEPGIYVIRCGLHKWMHAIVVSTPHPYYAVSDEAGGFFLEDVPEGQYTLEIWHEALGTKQASIDLVDSITDFSYTFKPE